ncbi:hypothetical protein KAJ89_05210 [Candidatus Parcubacteria bacterium]|nr:hypothetical protein [Candidatus Parcubacteria bacterium]
MPISSENALDLHNGCSILIAILLIVDYLTIATLIILSGPEVDYGAIYSTVVYTFVAWSINLIRKDIEKYNYDSL